MSSRALGIAVSFGALACTAPPGRLTPRPTPVHVEKARAAPTPPTAAEEEGSFDPTRAASSYLATSAPTPTRFARVAFYETFYGMEPGEGVGPLARTRREEAWSGHVVPVVEKRPKSVRVILEEDGLRLVVYLLDGDLHAVVKKRAPAVLGKRGQPDHDDTTGVWLRPGLVGSERGVLRSVEIADDIYSGQAWVHRSALDRVYEPESDAEPGSPAYLVVGSAIASKAGVTLLTTKEQVVVDELDVSGARTRVRYVSDALWIEGWVATSGLEHPDSFPGPMMGDRGRGLWGGGHEETYLHAGDLLRASPHGEVIGLVIDERLRTLGDTDDAVGRTVSARVGGWEFVPLWISPEDLAYGEAWEKVYHDRVHIEPLPGAAALPWQLRRREAVSMCWSAAIAAGVTRTVDLRFEWKSGRQATLLQAPKLDATLRACLENAFDDLSNPPPQLPIPFTVRLEPTPLPTR